VEAIIHNANDVTEQRHADAMLRESEERYRTLFNTIDQGYATAEVIFDESGKAVDLVYLETNAAFEELTGVKNAAGRSAGQIIPGLGEFWCETYGKVILTGESVRFENYVEGLNRWFDVFASRIGGEDSRKVALVFSNITDRKKAEQSIRFQAHLLNTVEQSAIATDLDGTVTYWNQFAEKLYGWTAEEAVGRQISELTTPDIMANQAAEIMSQLRRGISWAGEFNVKRRDGTVFPAYVINSPIETEAGELVGIIGISVDITERKRVEEELLRSRESLERRVEERTRELAKMNAALHTENVERRKIEAERVGILQRLVTSQEDVRRRLGRDLHDQLGQQVTALRFRLEALAELTSNNPELKEQVRHAQDYAKRVDADVGFFAFELRPTALDDLGLAAAIDIFVNEWSRNHKISAEFYARPFEETLPPETKINVYRIVQEALNNIFKHAKAKSVTVHLDLQKDTLVLIITDDGIGFDLEKKKINIGSGSGLGLIGMRERCILVGGNLEIETAPGKGTVIFARVPA
ncbi:MAG TPA: PAS domain S-box protein, partial [Pyrinomonadaceae bacterium]|nr:PAS domain S-box protein [Pyrinomonadaceae bacterium]